MDNVSESTTKNTSHKYNIILYWNVCLNSQKVEMDDIEDDLSIEIPQITVTEIFKCTEIMKNYSIQEGDINLLNTVSQVNDIVEKSMIRSKIIKNKHV